MPVGWGHRGEGWEVRRGWQGASHCTHPRCPRISAAGGWSSWTAEPRPSAGSCEGTALSPAAPRAPRHPGDIGPHVTTSPPSWQHSQEEDDASVGHGVGQPQDAAAHDGIAQVEDRHPKRRLAFELCDKEGTVTQGGDAARGQPGGPALPLTSVKCVCFFSLPWGRNSSISAPHWFSSNLGAEGGAGQLG